jgi:uncharacterized protein
MTIKSDLENDLKHAMKNDDTSRKRVIRMVLASIKLAEVEKGSVLDDEAVMSVLQREVKSRREVIVDAERAGRSDLVDQAEEDIVLLESYLPKQLSEAELEAFAREAIRESGATSVREMGQVMKLLMPRLQGRATGNEASLMVKKLLS